MYTGGASSEVFLLTPQVLTHDLGASFLVMYTRWSIGKLSVGERPASDIAGGALFCGWLYNGIIYIGYELHLRRWAANAVAMSGVTWRARAREWRQWGKT